MDNKERLDRVVQISNNEEAAVALFNSNVEKTNRAIEDSLSRTGKGSNNMLSNLDMGGNAILNTIMRPVDKRLDTDVVVWGEVKDIATFTSALGQNLDLLKLVGNNIGSIIAVANKIDRVEYLAENLWALEDLKNVVRNFATGDRSLAMSTDGSTTASGKRAVVIGSDISSASGNLVLIGTDIVKDPTMAICNEYAMTQSVAIGDQIEVGQRSVNIGSITKTSFVDTAIGPSVSAKGHYSVAIGFGAATSKDAQGAIQLGAGTNSVPHTFSVGLLRVEDRDGDGVTEQYVYNYQLLDAEGKIPAERIPTLSSYATKTEVQDAISSYEEADTALQTQITGLSGVVTTNQSDIVDLKAQKYGANLSYSDSMLQLVDQDGNGLGDAVTISGGGGASAWGSITGDITAQTDLQEALEKSSKITQLGFNGVLEGSVLTFTPTEGSSTVYDIKDFYGYEIDLLFEAVGELDDSVTMVIQNGEDTYNIVNVLHDDATTAITVGDMKQIMKYSTDIGWRWIFNVRAATTEGGNKVFVMPSTVSASSDADLSSYATKEYVDTTKQDKLTAGANITIEGNVISSTGGSGGSDDYYRSLDETQKAQLLADGTYEEKDVEAGEIFAEYDGKFVEFDKTLNPGTSWAESTTQGLADGLTYLIAKDGSGKYYAASTSSSSKKAYTSEDGQTWTALSTPPYPSSNLVTLNGTVWSLRSGYVGYIYYIDSSNNFIKPDSLSNFSCHKGFYENGVYLLTGNTGASHAYSTDGINFTIGTSTVSNCCFDGEKFVGYDSTSIKTSTDGINWVEVGTCPISPKDIAYCQGKYFVVYEKQIAYSENLTDWTTITPFTVDMSVLWVNGDKILAGYAMGWNEKSKYFSVDGGLTWTQINSITSSTSGYVSVLDGAFYEMYGNSQAKLSLTPYYEYFLTPLSYNKSEVDTAIAGVDLTGYLKNTATGSNISTGVAETSAESSYQIAIGSGDSTTTTSGEGAIAIGGAPDEEGTSPTQASGQGAIAIGRSAASMSGNCVSIGFVSRNYADAINCTAVGALSRTAAKGSVAIGYYSLGEGAGSTSIGANSSATGILAVALGNSSVASAQGSIQIGQGTNSTANTLSVGLSETDNYLLLNADGTIPAERLVNAPVPDLTSYLTKTEAEDTYQTKTEAEDTYQVKIEDSEDIAFATVDNFSVAGTMTISDAKEATGFTSGTNYLTGANHGIPAASEDFEMVIAFSSLSASASGSLLTIPFPTGSSFNVGIRLYSGKISAFCGSTGTTIASTSAITANTKTYAKLVRKDGMYTLYSSTDGSSWTEEASAEGTAISSEIYATADIGKTSGTFLTVYLPETYIKVAGVETWRAVAASKGLKIVSAPKTSTTAPDTTTVGSLGQIFVDTATGTGYMCVGVDTATPAYTWKQVTA